MESGPLGRTTYTPVYLSLFVPPLFSTLTSFVSHDFRWIFWELAGPQTQGRLGTPVPLGTLVRVPSTLRSQIQGRLRRGLWCPSDFLPPSHTFIFEGLRGSLVVP